MKTRRRIEPTIGGAGAQQVEYALDRVADPEPARPGGVTFIATLLILAGIIGLCLQFTMGEEIASALRAAGLPAQLAAMELSVGGIIALAAGLLMFDASKWGWTLAMVLLVAEMLGSLQALLLAQELGVELALMRGATLSPYTKYCARMVFEIVIIAYLFGAAARSYFTLTTHRALQLLCFAVAVPLTAVALVTLLAQ